MNLVCAIVLAATLFETSKDGVSLKATSETTQIDPARSVFLRVELACAAGRTARLPDIRDRVVGFSLAEDFSEEPSRAKDGSTALVASWRLVPEPCAAEYRIRPFVVEASADGGRDLSFVAGPVAFGQPAAREPVTGGMETDPRKDLPPLSWALAGKAALALAVLAALAFAAWRLVRLAVRRVRERRMSPIERAWAELGRLLQRGLPGRGRYKDFYVELTMVVRRYVQRRYGVRAPHLTTEEFLSQFRDAGGGRRDLLARFLESADLVKFAGVEANPETADAATEAARTYLKDDAEAKR